MARGIKSGEKNGKFRAWLRWKGYNDNLSVYTKSRKAELKREYLKSKKEYPR